MTASTYDHSDQNPIERDDPASLLPAYALHALPEADARAAEAFLAAGGERATAALGAWEETAAMLPYLLEPAAPAPQLRTRVLARVYADALAEPPAPGVLPGGHPHAPFGPAVPSRLPVSLAARRAPTRLFGWVSGAVAAILLFAALGLGAWSASLQDGVAVRDRVIADQRDELAAVGTTRTIAGTQPGASARGELLRLANPQAAVLTISGLPPLAQGRVYQVWFIQGTTPVGAGVFSPNPDGSWSGLVRGDVTTARTIAITAEPTGGSPAPTGDIVAAGML